MSTTKMKTRGRPRMTVKQKLHAFLARKDEFTPLPTIYKSLKAKTTGDKACIRGLLNRGCGENGLFVRNQATEGEYRAA